MINRLICQTAAILAVFTGSFTPSARAQYLDQIGVTLLRAVTTNLNGSSIRVAQPEASLSATQPVWAVNPIAVGQPVGLFTYYSSAGSTNFFPKDPVPPVTRIDSSDQFIPTASFLPSSYFRHAFPQAIRSTS